MKLKHSMAILLTVLLMLAISSCSNGTSSNGSKSPANEPSNEANTAVDDNPYGLDYESGDEQPMSSDRLPKEKLSEAYDYFVGMDASERAKLTYEDMVDYIGCDASAYSYLGTYRTYIWYAEDNEYTQMNASIGKVNGVWQNPLMSGGNLR